MKRLLVTVFALAVVLSFGLSAQAQNHQKSSWYIGFGIGSGSASYEGDSIDDIYPNADTSTPLTLNFGVGAILSDNLMLGLDISALRESASAGSDEVTYQTNNYLASAMFFPMGEGFSIKGGLGLCAFQSSYDISGSTGSNTYNGYAFLVGAGYDFWLGETFNLGIRAEYSRQTYSDDEGPDDTDFINVFVSFYWF